MKTLYDGWQSNEWINSLFHLNYEVDNVLSEWEMTHQNIHLFSIWETSFMWELTSQLICYFSLRGLPFLPWVSFKVLESWSLSFLKMSWDPTIVDWGVMGKNYINSWCEPLKRGERIGNLAFESHSAWLMLSHGTGMYESLIWRWNIKDLPSNWSRSGDVTPVSWRGELRYQFGCLSLMCYVLPDYV